MTFTLSLRYLVNVAKVCFVTAANVCKCLGMRMKAYSQMCHVYILCKYSANLLSTFANQCKYDIPGLPYNYLHVIKCLPNMFFSSSVYYHIRPILEAHNFHRLPFSNTLWKQFLQIS